VNDGFAIATLGCHKPMFFIRKRKVCLLGSSEPVAKPGVDKIKKT